MPMALPEHTGHRSSTSEITLSTGRRKREGEEDEGETADKRKTTYKVRKGDNLTKIAKKLGMTVEELIELNPYLADNPDLIYAGEELNIDRSRIGRDTSGMRGKKSTGDNQIIYSGGTGLVDGSISNTTVWVNMNQVNGVEKRKKDGGKIYIVERVDKGEEMMGNMAVYKNENKEIGAEVISEYSTGVIDKELMERRIGETNWIRGEGIRREWSTNDRWEIKEAYLTYDEVGTMREGIELLMGL